MAKKRRDRQVRANRGGALEAKPASPAPARRPDPRGWRIAFLILCTVGACLSADLLRLHVNVHTDPEYHSYCAMSERVNCDTVAASDFAVVLGLPLALWGLVAYLGMGVLAVWGLREKRRGAGWPLGLMFWFGAGSAALGVALYLVSHMVIESVCIVCAGTYLVNFGLAFVAFMALRRAGSGPLGSLREDLGSVSAARGPFALYAGGLAAILIAAWIFVPPYWRIEVSTGPGGLPVGVTAQNHPWIGGDQPLIEIEEFSDYQCPHCLRGHDEVRRVVATFPGKVRLVHRNFPLDQECNGAVNRPFHLYACRYARLATCALRQGKFWEANDFLFAQGRRSLPVTAEELARTLDLDEDQLGACAEGEEAEREVQRDLEAGRALGVRGTPTFVLDGETYPGRIPPEVLSAKLSERSGGGAAGADGK